MVERPGSQIPSNNSRHWWACWVWEWGHWPDGGVQEEFLNLLNCSTGQIVYLEFSAFLLISSRRVIKSYVRRWWELGEQGSSGRGVIFKIYLFRFVPISLPTLTLGFLYVYLAYLSFGSRFHSSGPDKAETTLLYEHYEILEFFQYRSYEPADRVKTRKRGYWVVYTERWCFGAWCAMRHCACDCCANLKLVCRSIELHSHIGCPWVIYTFQAVSLARAIGFSPNIS